MKLRSLVKKQKEDRRGQGQFVFFLWFFIALFLIMFAGIIIAIFSAVTNYVFDVWTPEVTDLGDVSGANFTEIAGYTITPLNDVVQSFTWIAGIIYVFFLIGIILLAYLFSDQPNRWLLGLFFGFVFITVIASIFISQIYEDFYDDNDEIGQILQEHVLLSFMILHSPIIITAVSLIAGVILFSGMASEDSI